MLKVFKEPGFVNNISRKVLLKLAKNQHFTIHW